VTLATLIANGGGQLGVQMRIEGFPYSFVTHKWMESAALNQIHGLLLDGMKFDASLDLVSGRLESGGFRVKIVDTTDGKLASYALGRAPIARTWITSSLTTTSATVTVLSTTGFATSGTIYIGTEAITYTGVTATTFTGCTRGWYQSTPQAHYVTDGENKSLPPVTDYPTTIEGRRARFYLYDAVGDAASGASFGGTLRWRGFVATDAHYSRDGWSIAIDPPTSVLKQETGGGAGDEVGIRGIYHPWCCPAVVTFSVPSIPLTESVVVRGYYESQDAFCTDLQTAINATSLVTTFLSGTASIKVIPGEQSFDIVYRAGSGTIYDLQISTPGNSTVFADWPMRRLNPESELQWTDTATAFPAAWDSTASGSTFSVTFASPFPRSQLGVSSPGSRRRAFIEFGFLDPGVQDTFPENRVYFAERFGLGIGMAFAYKAGESDWTSYADTADAANGYATLQPVPEIVLDSTTKFKVGRRLGVGNFGGLIDQLASDGPVNCNLGKMPLITADTGGNDRDFMTSTGDVFIETSGVPLINERDWWAFDSLTLEEMLIPELQAAGYHLSLQDNGQIYFRKAHMPVIGAVASATLTARTIGGDVEYERQALGTVTSIEWKTGFVPADGEHRGVTYRIRDVTACSSNRAGRTMQIKRASLPNTVDIRNATPDAYTRQDLPRFEEIVERARIWLAMLGRDYWVAHLNVPMTFFDLKIGDDVSVTCSLIPNAAGGLGVTSKPAMVIGKSYSLDSGRGTISVLMHDRDIRGYAPSLQIGSPTNITGNQWDVTVSREDALVPPSTWFKFGDLIRIRQRDATSPTTLTGSVDSVTDGTDKIRVTLSSAWTPSTSLWAIGPGLSDVLGDADSIAKHVFVATSAGRVTLVAGTRNASEFAP
jgi:hypothetical protein